MITVLSREDRSDLINDLLSSPVTKTSLVQNVINYLGDPGASIECEDTGSFVDQLVPWMQSSNFKV